MEAVTTRAWEEKAAEEGADTGGVISASIGDGGDFNSFLETVLSDCDESPCEPTTPPEEVEVVATTRTSNRRGVSETHDEFAARREDDEDREGEDHFEDGASAGEGNGAIAADVPLLSRKDCNIGVFPLDISCTQVSRSMRIVWIYF